MTSRFTLRHQKHNCKTLHVRQTWLSLCDPVGGVRSDTVPILDFRLIMRACLKVGLVDLLSLKCSPNYAASVGKTSVSVRIVHLPEMHHVIGKVAAGAHVGGQTSWQCLHWMLHGASCKSWFD